MNHLLCFVVRLLGCLLGILANYLILSATIGLRWLQPKSPDEKHAWEVIATTTCLAAGSVGGLVLFGRLGGWIGGLFGLMVPVAIIIVLHRYQRREMKWQAYSEKLPPDRYRLTPRCSLAKASDSRDGPTTAASSAANQSPPTAMVRTDCCCRRQTKRTRTSQAPRNSSDGLPNTPDSQRQWIFQPMG